MKTNKLPDGDYTLTENRAWLGVNGATIRVFVDKNNTLHITVYEPKAAGEFDVAELACIRVGIGHAQSEAL